MVPHRSRIARPAALAAALLVAAVGVAAVPGASSAAPLVPAPVNSRDPRATDQIIVRMADGSTPNIAALAVKAGEPVALQRQLAEGAWVGKLGGRRSPADAQALAARIATLPGVAYAEPDAMMLPTATPTDPLWSSQWDLTAGTGGANLPAAWDITTGASDVVVAVIDTGITNHADLAGQTVPGYDFINDALVANDGNTRDSNPADPGDWVTATENASGYFAGCGTRNSSWHGTHVSGTIAALSNNGIGVAGIASGVKVLPVRVLGKCGGYTSDIVDGMRWAVGLAVAGVPTNPNPAAVLNLSLGGSGVCGITQQQAIDEIVAVGATVVVAAGNSNADATNFNPANCANVITVASTGSTASRAYYSNYGSLVEIAAPGGDSTLTPGGILSTLNAGTTTPTTDTYASYQGTSMATPHVAGVAALVKSVQPSLSPAALTTLLRSTVTPFPAGSTCATALCGSGILNAGSAVTTAATTNGPRVLGAFSKTAPAPGAITQPTSLTLSWSASSVATGYEYCLVAGLTTPCTWTSAGTATSVAATGLAGSTLYSWQVRATDGTNSAEANVSLRSTFTTAAAVAPPGAFAKTAPVDAATNVATSTTLSWGASTSAVSYEYCLDTVVNTTCDGTWTTTGTARSVAVSALATSTTYEWQVRARNTGGTTAANANTAWTFRTAAPALPGAFAKSSPSNGATARPTTLTLSWAASTGAVSYEYCLDTTANNACDTSWISTGANRGVSRSGLSGKTAYYWQVRAVNVTGTTLANAGTWWKFTTK